MTKLSVLLLCGCLAVPAWAQTARPERLGSIAGRVLRPDGLPQPDAEVVAATRGRDGRLRLTTWRARTAFDGQYAISGVPAGRYLVLVRVVGADSAGDGRPEATLFPGVPVTEPGTAVDVFDGVPVAGVDIWLQPSPRRFQVSGRVVDPTGARSRTSPSNSDTRARVPTTSGRSPIPAALHARSRCARPIVLRARGDSPDGPLVGVAAAVLAVESPRTSDRGARSGARARPHRGAQRRCRRPACVARPDAAAPVGALSGRRGARGRVGRVRRRGTVGEHEVRVSGCRRAGFCVHPSAFGR
jgi:hypothetical protein